MNAPSLQSNIARPAAIWLPTDPEIASQFYLLSVISPITALALVLFSPLELVAAVHLRQGYAFLLAASLIILNLVVLRQTRNIWLARLILTLTTFILALSLFLSGQVERSNLFWLYLIPIVAYFFGGTRRGSVWLLGFFALWVGLIGLQLAHLLALPYTFSTLSQLAVNLLAVSLLALLFESARAAFEASARAREEELERRNEALEQLTQDLNQETARLGVLNEREEAILRGIGEGVVAIDRAGKVILFNQAAERLTGYPAGQVIGQPYRDRLYFSRERESQRFDEFIEAARQGKRSALNRAVLLMKNGTQFSVAAVASPFVDEQGRIQGVVIVFRDITEERRIERLKDEFVSIASHELRTPMTAIKSLLSMINEEDYGPVNPNLQAPLGDIATSTERLIHLVNTMLNLARIEAGVSRFQLTRFRPQAVVKEVVLSLKPLAEKKGLRLAIAGFVDEPIQADKSRLIEVLINLLDNAIKFTRRGGVTLTSHLSGEQLVTVVTDTGSGIAPGERRQLFGKFQQTGNIIRDRPAGTGLGLYLARELCRRMGGELWLERSAVGQGSVFAFSLPLARSAVAAKLR